MFNDKDKIFKKILIIAILIVVGILLYFIIDSSLNRNKIEKTEKIETVQVKTDKEIAKEALFENEMNKFIRFLNRGLKQNYLKIEKYKKTKIIKLSKHDKNPYEDSNENIEFFMFKLAKDKSTDSLADFDIYINHGSKSKDEFIKKSGLGKKQVKIKLEQYFTDNNYDKIIDNVLYGYIYYNEKDNIYTIGFIGDYLYNTFGKEQGLLVEDITNIAILQEYFNYGRDFLTIEDKEILSRIKSLKQKTKNKQFVLFLKKLEQIYFSNNNK